MTLALVYNNKITTKLTLAYNNNKLKKWIIQGVSMNPKIVKIIIDETINIY
jgi:hypothetical protein